MRTSSDRHNVMRFQKVVTFVGIEGSLILVILVLEVLMRISIPSIKFDPLTKAIPPLPREAAIARLVQFLAQGKVAVLTGAGISVDSGIRAYRGRNGRYLNPNYHPIFYHELVDPTPTGHSFRQRYWARSYLGWEAVRQSSANPSHFAISALQHSNLVKYLITQNVDGLHVKAAPPSWGSYELDRKILELHGKLRTVSCRHKHSYSRTSFQERITKINPSWKEYVDELRSSGAEPRTNPDGDVELRGRAFDDFQVPPCERCLREGKNSLEASVMKPDVIFFGETIDATVKERSLKNLEECERLLVIGTTLATYSAFRIVKHAVELQKPILMLNVGPTRADPLNIEKIEWKTGDVLTDACVQLLGPRMQRDQELQRLLTSGIVQPPLEDD